MSFIRSRYINIGIIFITAFLMVFTYFFDIPVLANLVIFIQRTVTLIAALTLGWGAINFTMLAYKQVQNKTPTAPFHVYAVVVMLLMIVTGLIPPLLKSPQFLWMYNNVEVPADQTMYAMLAFFVASSCFRAFRARSKESLVMLVAGTFIIFTNIPIGSTISPVLPMIGNWIRKYPMTGASRGFNICVALGSLGITLRILLGREKAVTGE